MEILKLIIAFLLYTLFVAIATGVFMYCVAFLYPGEADPDDETFLK